MNRPSLDIVLPCYNPTMDWVERLCSTYDQLSEQLHGIAIRFILVDDGSKHPPTDRDIANLQAHIPQFDYLHYEINKGKGYALRKGIDHSNAPICIYTDIDFPYTLIDVMKMYQQLAASESDIVVGIKNESYYEQVSWLRMQISKVLQVLIKLFLRIPITDTQCGLKGFNQKGRTIFLQTTIERYLCDLEFIFLASRQSDIAMIPLQIELRENVAFGKFGWRVLLVESMNFVGVFLRSLSR